MERQSAPSPRLTTLPVELVRIVFEIAACQSQANAAHLVLVSKNAQEWIAPILYHTIVVDTSQAMLTLYETIHVAKSRFAGHTRALYLPPPCPVPTSFLANFPALQHLAISALSLRLPPLPSFLQNTLPHPTSITITGPLGHGIYFKIPIFQRCTHLYLADDVPRPFSLTAQVLPCLTHLACAYRHGTSSTTAVTCLPLLLAQNSSDHTAEANSRPSLPYHRTPLALRVLVLELYLSNGSPDATMFVMHRLGLGRRASESHLRADPRLVLQPGAVLTPQRWKNFVINNDMWTIAEDTIRIQSDRSVF